MHKRLFSLFLAQDGQTVSFARRESDESAIAEANEAAPGKYPVLVVEGANHAQVANGKNTKEYLHCTIIAKDNKTIL